MEQIPNYNCKEVEENIENLWKKNNVYKQAKDKNAGKQKFYYLDGPPYTSGKIHIGHAWGKALRDMLMRYKRMKGFNVWDRSGFDMHGLPISHKVEAKLGIKGKEAIEAYGVEAFIKECKLLAVDNMNSMITDFKRLGVWMDFDNPYKPIDNSYIEGIWWLIKKAHDNNRLYEGKRTLTWCANCETSAAKHELEYENVKDQSIFVKFKIKDTTDNYLVIWTTTPWTIPFNLAVMVNPDVDYVKVKVENEFWIVAKVLAEPFIKTLVDKEYTIVEEFKGSTLAGVAYTHPFENEIDYPKSEKLHTVLLSAEYVDTSGGSGLVHCAPGCGGEDYEVGYKNGLPAFNNVNEQGVFENMGIFSGLKAKVDDKEFIRLIDNTGALIAKTPIVHDYPHCERCHNPIIFRSTKQWFFKVEDLKEKMKGLNKDINWVPDWAGSRQFHSWLDNLRDNSITKQIHWGTPFPVWKCESETCNEYTVVGDSKELAILAGEENVPKDLHKPFIDAVKIPCKCGRTQIKCPDVLDVWVDAGSSSWLCLDYPVRTDLFEEMFPADFILEGKDQIRGWFNLLFVAGMVSMDKPTFKACYMHGFINDSKGRKMSKSLGNVISPYEVIDTYGSDTLRYYMIGAANPGLDMNYNSEDMIVCYRNLGVFWNLHKYVIDTSRALNIKPTAPNNLSIEDKYILSKLNSTIKKLTEHLDKYELNVVPKIIEELVMDLSRTYVQLIRDKLVVGTDEEKSNILHTMNKVFTESLKMFAVVSPYISDAMYQNFKQEFNLEIESIHLFDWPKHDDNMIDEKLESDFEIAKDTIQSILACREKAQLGVRWPIKEITVIPKNDSVKSAVENLKNLVMVQTNVKSIIFEKEFSGVTKQLKPNFKPLGQDFGKNAQKVAMIIPTLSPDKVLGEGESIDIEGESLIVKEKHVNVEREVSQGYETSDYKQGELYLNKERTFALDAEGYSREMIRRVQDARKTAGLQKIDSINLVLIVSDELKKSLDLFVDDIKIKCGCKNIMFEGSGQHTSEGKIKEEEVKIFFDKI